MPVDSHDGGSGGPGVFLEDLLGLTAGGMDIPDAVGWELKWHTDRTGLVTLFHKESDALMQSCDTWCGSTAGRTSRAV